MNRKIFPFETVVTQPVLNVFLAFSIKSPKSVTYCMAFFLYFKTKRNNNEKIVKLRH